MVKPSKVLKILRAFTYHNLTSSYHYYITDSVSFAFFAKGESGLWVVDLHFGQGIYPHADG